MKCLLILVLLLLLFASTAYSADALLCSSSKHTSNVVRSDKVEGKDYIVLPEAGWDAVPGHLNELAKLRGVTRVVALGQSPSVESIQAAALRIRAGDYDCIKWDDPTRNDACDTLQNTIDRAASPVCNAVLALGEPVAASVGNSTATAKCKLPGGGFVRLSLRCYP